MSMITETHDAVTFDTIAVAENGWAIDILDQTFLPHDYVIKRLTKATEGVEAISAMRVRGAPLIGVTAAYTVALACLLYTSPSPRDSSKSRMPSYA